MTFLDTRRNTISYEERLLMKPECIRISHQATLNNFTGNESTVTINPIFGFDESEDNDNNDD